MEHSWPNSPPDPPAATGFTGTPLDCRGRRCPLPVIALAREISGVPIGGTIRVLADDPAAAVDIPAWCRMRGHTFLGEVSDSDGTPAFDVRRDH